MNKHDCVASDFENGNLRVYCCM